MKQSVGAEIDALLALSYDENYQKTARKADIFMATYSNYHGLQINFSVDQFDVYGQCYKKSDIADFNYSTSENTRWSEIDLLKHLCKQYTILEIAPFPEN